MYSGNAITENAPEVNETPKYTHQFVFRKIRARDLEKLLEEYEESEHERIKAEFEVVDRDTEGEPSSFRRKPVDVHLNLPNFISGVPEENQNIVREIIGKELASFVRSMYVDNFEPIGEHSLEFYSSELAKRGTRAVRWEFTPEQLEQAAGSLQNYLAEVTGIAKVGEAVAKAAAGKFTRASIQRCIGKFDEETLSKLSKHINNWAAHVAENEPDNAEDYESVYYSWCHTLDKHMAKDTLDVSSFL